MTTNIPAESLSGLPPPILPIERAHVIGQTTNTLGALKTELLPAVISFAPIAAVTYLTVAGIQTLFGYPPGWVQALGAPKR